MTNNKEKKVYVVKKRERHLDRRGYIPIVDHKTILVGYARGRPNNIKEYYENRFIGELGNFGFCDKIDVKPLKVELTGLERIVDVTEKMVSSSEISKRKRNGPIYPQIC